MAASAIERLTEENEILKEQIVQLKNMLVPPAELPQEWRLTGNEATIFRCLMSRDVADKDFIWHSLYGDRVDNPPEQKIIDVHICYMRRKLRPFGIQIGTVWGRGFSLSDRRRHASELAA
ncbi:helix-turn-helix domain-containing protein [Brucella sp. HL-2]|nr:helix-turn-helix domain-containing protein [Brucella sp. HL-2]MCV9910196.1 helix-turn-helix domain-containing protein [Brucella sp. HL-2]